MAVILWNVTYAKDFQVDASLDPRRIEYLLFGDLGRQLIGKKDDLARNAVLGTVGVMM